MNYSSRFWLYAPSGLFALLAAAVMTNWWMVAGAFEKKLAALKGRETVPGIILDWDKVEVGGFPFRVDANFQNFRIAGAGAHGPFAWRSEKFAMHGLAYGRSQDVYEAAGRQNVQFTRSNGTAATLIFQFGSMRGSSISDEQGLRRFDLDVVNLVSSDLTTGRFQFHLRRDPNGSDLDLMVNINALQKPGTKTGNLQFYAALSQVDALDGLLRGTRSWPQAVGDWRSKGGTTKLSQINATGDLLVSPQLVLSPLY